MKISVCGIVCEKCPRMINNICPNGERGCMPKENMFCQVATCAYRNDVNLCVECREFPCDTTKLGPINTNTVSVYLRESKIMTNRLYTLFESRYRARKDVGIQWVIGVDDVIGP